MARFEPPFYPIVLIRGFAMKDKNIEQAVEQVYTGFNEGSTKLKQVGVDRVTPFFFESVVVRLMKDLGYEDAYRDNDFGAEKVKRESFWVYRYYDLASKAFGSGDRYTIEYYARRLRSFIVNKIRPAICGDDKDLRDSFKVHLVSHSMGGLIVRCYLQNICRHNEDPDPELELGKGASPNLVDRVFTYGTPHNGIDLLDINVPGLSSFEIRAFNRRFMAKYLKLQRDDRPWDHKEGVASLDGAIDPQRVFNFIGTDWQGFDQISKHLTRGQSDGLVEIRNAYTLGPPEGVDDSQTAPPARTYSPRAYAHRAHGGPYGIVNSEAGYQNLRRFLFGTHRIDVSLNPIEATHVPDVRRRLRKDLKEADVDYWYYVDVIAYLRNIEQTLHERSEANCSAVLIRPKKDFEKGKEVVLFTGFLDGGLTRKSEMVGEIRLAVGAPQYGEDFGQDRFPGSKIFGEQFRFHVPKNDPAGEITVERVLGGERTILDGSKKTTTGQNMEWRARIGYDPTARSKPSGSIAAELILRVSPHV
jgi:hypothetical protein